MRSRGGRLPQLQLHRLRDYRPVAEQLLEDPKIRSPKDCQMAREQESRLHSHPRPYPRRCGLAV